MKRETKRSGKTQTCLRDGGCLIVSHPMHALICVAYAGARRILYILRSRGLSCLRHIHPTTTIYDFVLAGGCLVAPHFVKIFKITHHIESFDACMKH